MEMNENSQEQRADSSTKNNDRGSEPKATSLIDEANAAAERLERANKEKALLLAREEQLMARKALGGLSEGPQQAQEKPKPLTNREYAEALSKGFVPKDY